MSSRTNSPRSAGQPGRRRGGSRRAFLSGLGASMGLAPFLPVFNDHAAAAGFPTRLILLFSPSGTFYDRWLPTGGGKDFALSPILEPLEAHKDALTIVGGVGFKRSGPGDGHQKGTGMCWTGSRLIDTGEEGDNGKPFLWGGGPSVDQHVAAAIGQDTVFPSLQTAVQPNVYSGGGSASLAGPSVWSRTIYKGSADPIAPEVDPQMMFDRVFGDPQLGREEGEQIRARRRSVLDTVGAQLGRLESRYGVEDGQKIEAHLQSIRELELRNEAMVADCSVPSIGTALDPDANENFPALSRNFMDSLVMAMSCDLTRVASLQWSRSVGYTRFEWAGLTEGHHEISHQSTTKENVRQKVVDYNRWFAGELAYLIGRLKEIPEGNGTMLDNTLIVWGNELGEAPSHKTHNVPFVLAGGAGGRIDPGTFLNFPDGVLHHRLLVSICHAMGLAEQTTFGDLDEGSGGLPGLT